MSTLFPRIGHGIDVHRFGPGDSVTLGGVVIPHDQGLVAHSDGDVALHALCDAILGALALGDIGQHFPDTDARWKGADSRALLRETARRVAGRRTTRRRSYARVATWGRARTSTRSA